MTKMAATAILLLVVLPAGIIIPQNSKVSWWTLANGFGTSSSSGISATSAIGQPFIGTGQQGNTLVTSGFLADTLLRGPVLDVLPNPAAPATFALRQNYPNPFNPSTTFAFDLPYSSFVILKIHNILGQEVATLVNEERPAGTYSIRWDASGAASGVYFYTMRSGSFGETRKLVLLR